MATHLLCPSAVRGTLDRTVKKPSPRYAPYRSVFVPQCFPARKKKRLAASHRDFSETKKAAPHRTATSFMEGNSHRTIPCVGPRRTPHDFLRPQQRWCTHPARHRDFSHMAAMRFQHRHAVFSGTVTAVRAIAQNLDDFQCRQGQRCEALERAIRKRAILVVARYS